MPSPALSALSLHDALPIFAAVACLLDEGFADRIAPQLRQSIANHQNWTESVNKANPLASTSIQANNITVTFYAFGGGVLAGIGDRKSTRLNSSHLGISYAVTCSLRPFPTRRSSDLRRRSLPA